MAGTIAFILLIVAFGVFMPDVFHALNSLLFAVFAKATVFVQTIPSGAADVSHIIR